MDRNWLQSPALIRVILPCGNLGCVSYLTGNWKVTAGE